MIFQHMLLDEILDTLIDENPLKLDIVKAKDPYQHEAAMMYSYVYMYSPPPPVVITEQHIADLAIGLRSVFEVLHSMILPVEVAISVSKALIENARALEKSSSGVRDILTSDKKNDNDGVEDAIRNVIDDLIDSSSQRFDDLPSLASSQGGKKWNLN